MYAHVLAGKLCYLYIVSLRGSCPACFSAESLRSSGNMERACCALPLGICPLAQWKDNSGSKLQTRRATNHSAPTIQYTGGEGAFHEPSRAAPTAASCCRVTPRCRLCLVTTVFPYISWVATEATLAVAERSAAILTCPELRVRKQLQKTLLSPAHAPVQF